MEGNRPKPTLADGKRILRDDWEIEEVLNLLPSDPIDASDLSIVSPYM